MDPYIERRLASVGVSLATKTVSLYHAAPRADAESIEQLPVVPAKTDTDASLPGRVPVRKVYLASSRDILDVIPHADAIVEVEVSRDVPLQLGEGDDESKAWAELVYEVPADQPGLPVISARVL